MLPVIFGLAGPTLGEDERVFFRDAAPAGYILFARNCADPAQMRRLTDDLKNLTGDDRTAILIDQEGGRVARMRPPHWAEHPPAARLGDLWRRDPDAARAACAQTYRAISRQLCDVGVTVNCIPCVDLPTPDADPVIGDRAFGDDPDCAIALGRVAIDTSLAAGIVPVVKHLPGHGRATVDSHKALPVVTTPRAALESRDFLPFHALNDAPMGMTAHITYTALDPLACASLSSTVIGQVIRAEFGFDGLIMCDDLSMAALGGPMAGRATGALRAGCDVVLHCNGRFPEMLEIAEAAPAMTASAAARLHRAMNAPISLA